MSKSVYSDRPGPGLDWREQVRGLADGLSKPASSSNGDFLLPSPAASPAAVIITASAQLWDMSPLSQMAPLPAKRQLPAALAQCPEQSSRIPLTQQERQASSAAPSAPASGAGSGARHSGSVSAGTRALSGGSQQHGASDQAVLSHHAAAINASLVAVGSRLAAAGSNEGSGRAAPHKPPSSRGLLSLGGTSATASMHSAMSGSAVSASVHASICLAVATASCVCAGASEHSAHRIR